MLQGLKIAVSDVLGFEVLKTLHYDARLLLSCKAVRMFAFGFLAIILVTYLLEIGISSNDIGIMFGLTLFGDALISLFLTSRADRWGRKKTLLLGSILSIITSLVFALVNNYWLMTVVAIIGVISPTGNEVGPFLAVELSSLAQVTKDEDRTRILAWHNLFGCFAAAIGALVCGGIVSSLHNHGGMTYLSSYRVAMIVYALTKVILLLITTQLSSDIEVPIARTEVEIKNVNPISLFFGLHKSKSIVLRLSGLFMLDAFGSSFVLQSFMSAWFFST